MVEDEEGTLELEWDCSPAAAGAPALNRPPGAAAPAPALALPVAFPAVDETPAFGAPLPLPAACEAGVGAEAEAEAPAVVVAAVAPRFAIARPRAMPSGGAEPGGPGGCVARQ